MCFSLNPYTVLPNLISLNFFCTSITITGTIDINSVIIHCVELSIVSLNILATLGINTIPTCNKVPNKNAPIKYLFSSIPALNMDS